MKLLLTADPFLPVPPTEYGGIERIVASLLAELRNRGHQVGLVSHPASTARADFFAPWPEVRPTSLKAHVRNANTLRAAVAQFDPLLVHSFSRVAYLLPLLIRRTPTVMSYQRFVSGRTIAIASRLAGSSIVFTGCSGHIAAMGEPYGGRWYAIPNFVNTHFYSWTSSVPPDAPLVFLSRVEPLKGADIAIEIAKSANRQLILAGNHSLEGHEGRYWLERIAPEIGRNGIEYIGPVDDAAKAALLARAAALIVPVQWDEPFGIVFAEALACGTPVISCPRGALPEIVREGVDGFLIDSIDEGKNAVEKLHTIDRAECRKRAETHFSSGVVVSRYEDVYVDLLRRTHARSV